jgi:hypothetical protein
VWWYTLVIPVPGRHSKPEASLNYELYSETLSQIKTKTNEQPKTSQKPKPEKSIWHSSLKIVIKSDTFLSTGFILLPKEKTYTRMQVTTRMYTNKLAYKQALQQVRLPGFRLFPFHFLSPGLTFPTCCLLRWVQYYKLVVWALTLPIRVTENRANTFIIVTPTQVNSEHGSHGSASC